MLYFDPEFQGFYKKLPPSVQKQATKALSHFSEDQRYTSLQFKCVNKDTHDTLYVLMTITVH